jgi:hypothetical protein
MIGVIGSSAPVREELAVAEEVGGCIAERGAALVCGGKGGVMEAACRGAKSMGGMTVGILPGGDKSSGNPYLDIVIPTGMGFARNVLVVLSSSGVVAVGGRYGTLSEIAYCLIYEIPVLGLGTWTLRERSLGKGIRIVETAREAVDRIFQEIMRKS